VNCLERAIKTLFKKCTAVLLVFIHWTPESQSITGETHHSSLREDN